MKSDSKIILVKKMKPSSRLKDLLGNLASIMLNPVSPYRTIFLGLLGAAFFGVLTLKEYTNTSKQVISDIKHNPATIVAGMTNTKRNKDRSKNILLPIMTIANIAFLLSGVVGLRYVKNQQMMEVKKYKIEDNSPVNISAHPPK
jgi:glucose uptake protein GlcU